MQTTEEMDPEFKKAFGIAADALYAANSRVWWSDAEIEDAADVILKALRAAAKGTEDTSDN